MLEFIEVLKSNPKNAYDFIANNYYKLSKHELSEVVKELLFALYETTTLKEHNDILKRVGEILGDYYYE